MRYHFHCRITIVAVAKKDICERHADARLYQRAHIFVVTLMH